jgi:sugar (pentulose or hexulose) kinase
MQILSLDIGTSSVKAAVLDVGTGEPVGSITRVEYVLDQPTPDTAVIPPERLWDAVVQAARNASHGQRVDGIGFSCLSPALVLLGEDDEPVTPIITHLDRRARPEARAAWAEVGSEFLASVGNKPLPGGLTAIVFQHLAREAPALAERVRRYLHVNGWLGLRLTGTAAFDRGNACFTGLCEALGSRDWSPHWCDYFGVDRAWLPPVLSGDATLGPLRAELARLFEVPAGVPVKLGTADTSCAMLAAGMGLRDLLHVVGTTQVLAVHVESPKPALNRLTRQLGVGEGFISVTHNPVGGVALDWLHQLCFRDQSPGEFYDQTVPAAMERGTPVVLDPAFLGGDRLEIEPRRAAFRELGLATDRLDLLAALLNAMRTHHRAAVAALGEERSYERVFLTGGGADVVHRLIPEYRTMQVVRLEEASLKGVARLFA